MLFIYFFIHFKHKNKTKEIKVRERFMWMSNKAVKGCRFGCICLYTLSMRISFSPNAGPA